MSDEEEVRRSAVLTAKGSGIPVGAEIAQDPVALFWPQRSLIDTVFSLRCWRKYTLFQLLLSLLVDGEGV